MKRASGRQGLQLVALLSDLIDPQEGMLEWYFHCGRFPFSQPYQVVPDLVVNVLCRYLPAFPSS